MVSKFNYSTIKENKSLLDKLISYYKYENNILKKQIIELQKNGKRKEENILI